MQFGRSVAAFVFLLAVGSQAAPAPKETIDEFFERYAMEWVRRNPEMATRTQLLPAAEQDKLDRELSPITDEAAADDLRYFEKGLAELKRFRRAELTPSQRVSAAILEWSLRNRVESHRFRDYNYVFEQMGGLQSDLPQFFSNLPVRREADARNYVVRLSQVAKRLDEGIAVARKREKKGIVPPKALLTATIEQVNRLIASEPAKSVWVTTLAERLDTLNGLSPSARADLLATAEGTVSASITPAYRRVIAMLESQLPGARTDEAGFWRLPGGAAAYEHHLQSMTSLRITADKVHQIGLEEVARIEKEMDRLLRQMGHAAGPLAERLKAAEDANPRAVNDGPGAKEKILAEYVAMIRDAEQRSDALFDLRPKAPVEVRRTPLFREANAAASYTGSAPDGSRPGIFWLPFRGTRYVASRSLAYHETVPGHHFQIALQTENKTLPKFRQFRLFRGTEAYAEGWGLYAERLAREQGWYEGDPHGELDSLTESDMFRARRLVVDTGIHAKRWTIEQGVAYGIRRNEVERYTAWPGQACAYKIGELKIVELREKARRELGADFSLKQFHNVVLSNGAMPLDVLAMVVDDFIAERKGARGRP